MNWPTLGVMLLTYDRLDYAQRTVAAMIANCCYSGEVVWHVADDGSPEGYREQLLEMLPEGSTVSNSEQRGYGASFNLASQVLHAKAQVILPLEDDWELLRPFRFDGFVQALLEGPVNCIRMGYIGYTQELRGQFDWIADQHFLTLDPESEEPHVWAGHPRLETVGRQRSIGEWPEGMNAGSTEFVVAQRKESRQGVAWPVGAILAHGDLFAHIGTIQARQDQKEGAIA